MYARTRRLVMSVAIALIASSAPASSAGAMDECTAAPEECAGGPLWCKVGCLGTYLGCSKVTPPDVKLCDIALDGCFYGCNAE